jgi:hypothetical protein
MLPASGGFENEPARWGAGRRGIIQDPPFDPRAHPGRREVDLAHGFLELAGVELGTGIEGDRDQLPVDVFLGCVNAFQAL